MDILIVNHNGGSIYHGPNLRTYYAAKELVQKGHKVTIASSSYSHKYSVLPKLDDLVTHEIIDGIDFKWVRCVHYKNLFQRIYSHFEFGFKLLFSRKKICKSADVVIFSGPPPEIFLFSWFFSKLLKAPIVSDVRDLWPRTQIEMSKWQWLNPYTYFLFISQYLLVRGSSYVVTPLPGAGKYFLGLSKRSKTVVIENGFDLSRKPNKDSVCLKVLAGGDFLSLAAEKKVTLAELNTTNKFIVGYSGSFDRDNDVDSLIYAAKKLSSRSDILFLFVGDGIKRQELIDCAENHSNMLVCDRVTSQLVPEIISVMDICFCGLKPKKIYQYGVSLAKSFEYMAARKPILWMVESFNNPVADSGGGMVVEAGNQLALVSAIERSHSLGKEKLSELGEKGYIFLEKNHSYSVLGNKWNELMELCKKDDE